jgi:hypothetical protein
MGAWVGEAGLTEDEFWSTARKNTNWQGMFNDLLTAAGSHLAQADPGKTMTTGPQTQVNRLYQVNAIATGAGRAWQAMKQTDQLLRSLRDGSIAMSRNDALAMLKRLSAQVRNGLREAFTKAVPSTKDQSRVSWQVLSIICALARVAEPGEEVRLLTTAKLKSAGAEHGFVFV